MPNVKSPEECKAVWEVAQEYLAKAEKGELQLTDHSKRDLQAKYSDRDSSIVEVGCSPSREQADFRNPGAHRDSSIF